MRKVLVLLLLMSLSLAGSAQEDAPSDFLRAMSITPNIPQNGYLFSYADYHTLMGAVGLEVPENWAAWEADGAQREVLFTYPHSGPSAILMTILQSGPEYETHIGADFFHLTHGVEVSQPPTMGIILLGDFTADAVKAAYVAQDYTEETAYGDATLLCPPDGCDTGLVANIRARSFHPFGGNLGRKEPVIVADGVLLNSPSLPMIEALGATYSGQADSLADLPVVQAIDAALAEYPLVYSVTAFEGHNVGLVDPFIMQLGTVTPDEIHAQLDEHPLPPYSHAVVAGMGDEAHNYSAILLTYADEASANLAAASVDARLHQWESLTQGQSFAEEYGAAGTLEPATVIADEASGQYIVTVRLVSEWPEEITVSNLAIPYSRFYNGFIRRDVLWLAWTIGE